MLTGTIINVLAVLAGSLAGLLLKWLAGHFSNRLSAGVATLGARLQVTLMQGLALCVIYIGISGSLKGSNTLAAIFSMAIGAVVGELLDLDGRMQRLGDWVQAKVSHLFRHGGGSIAEGFVTATLLYCVGAMAIVGSLENGLTGNYDTLKAKSVLDGISSIVFASSLGVGVAFSAAGILLYQGALSLLASYLSPVLNDAVVAEMGCVGSLLIVAIGLNMLKLTKIKVMNLVPAMFLPILLCRIL